HPARAAHAARVVGVIAGDAYLVANQLGMLESLPECRTVLQRLQQKLDGAAAALLEVVGAADGPDAHDPVGQRDHPHPAMIEVVDADVAGLGPRAPLRAAKVTEDRR